MNERVEFINIFEPYCEGCPFLNVETEYISRGEDNVIYYSYGCKNRLICNRMVGYLFENGFNEFDLDYEYEEDEEALDDERYDG